MLLLTVLFLGLLFLASYSLFERDLFAPPTVVSLGFVFAAICCFYNEKKWGLEFSSDTMWLLIAGITAFIVGSILAVMVVNLFHGGRGGFTHNLSDVSPICVATYKTVLIILFEGFTILLLFIELRRITGNTMWFQIVSTFREQTTRVNPEEYTMHLSRICRLSINLSFSAALIYAYVLGNNIALGSKQSFLNWVPVVLSCVISFMQGYRSDMLRLWIAILVVSYTLKKRKAGWKNSGETKKLIRMMALSMAGIAVVFVALRGTVGRSETDWDPLYYLTFYAGCSIANLDLFLKKPLAPSGIWGKETFYYIIQSIAVWFDKPELRYIFYKEFRMSPGKVVTGNVYTAIRPPYYDFGFTGMIVVMLLMGTFFTLLYLRVRDCHGASQIDFRLLLYSYIAYTFFMYFYNCYNTFISFAFVRIIVELLFFRWFVLGRSSKKPFVIRIK